jgi:AcrR family transcriptional regulator
MKAPPPEAEARRPYRQTARAAAAEATAERIVAAFRARLERMWFDEIRLEDVAGEAEVTVQTIIRRFGGKDGLLEAAAKSLGDEVMATRAVPPPDPDRVARAVIEDYEFSGDVVMRVLAQEDRLPALRRFTDMGRAEHRAWVAQVFASTLEGLGPEAARRRLDALVVATDLYVWKLVRRDMKRPVAELQALMARLIAAALTDPA